MTVADCMTQQARPDDGDLYIEGDNLPEVADAATALLCERKSGVYLRGDVPVMVVDDEALRRLERPYRVVKLDHHSLAQVINRHATVYKVNMKTGGYGKVNLPPAIAQTILAERRYAFPPLVAVAETPLVLPNGDELLRPGYTRDGLLLHFDTQQFSEELFTGEVTADQVDAAVGALCELLSGFPFVEAVDQAVALAMLMTAVFRPGLAAAPGFATKSHAPGTGKTTLQRMVSVIATGRDAGLIAWPDDEVEARKLFLAGLLQGDGQLPIDNVNGVLASPSLCLILTSPSFTQRLLGGNDIATVPTRAIVTVNGNNLQIAGDLVRRFLLCRLDAGLERPETRAFRFDPLALLAERRHEYVAACLCIARGYLASGDRMSLPPLAGFDGWSRLVREPLVWAGVVDPVKSVDIASQLDPDRQELEAMVMAVSGLIGQRDFDVASLVHEARVDTAMDDSEVKRCRAVAREAIEEVAMRSGTISNRALGKWLARVEGRIAIGRRFVRHRDEKGEAGLRWRLEPVSG